MPVSYLLCCCCIVQGRTAGTVLAVEQRGGRGTLSKLRGASNGHEDTNDLAFATQLRIRCRRGRAKQSKAHESKSVVMLRQSKAHD